MISLPSHRLHLTGFLRSHGRISTGVLERPSSTNRGRWQDGVYHVVVTLDPSRFAEKKQRRLHIGNLRSFRPHLPNRSSPRPVPSLVYDIVSERLSYPPNTTAFLYYFRSSEKPRIAGELRLRFASSDDHASFESGSDVLGPNGQPWSRSLYKVSKFDIPVYDKLREEGLVSDDLDAVLSSFPRKYRIRHLYTLNDTFHVDFSGSDVIVYATTEKGMERVRLYEPFAEKRPTIRTPYTGSALARFERSTLPEHKGTRTVLLRILKIITPVKCVIPLYNGYIVPPKEGELHRRTKNSVHILNPPVWSANIDESVSLRGLRLLWDI